MTSNLNDEITIIRKSGITTLGFRAFCERKKVDRRERFTKDQISESLVDLCIGPAYFCHQPPSCRIGTVFRMIGSESMYIVWKMIRSKISTNKRYPSRRCGYKHSPTNGRHRQPHLTSPVMISNWFLAGGISDSFTAHPKQERGIGYTEMM